MMTPIESHYDVRWLTLCGVTMEVIEELALLADKDPDLILAETLYRINKRIHELGEEPVANKLLSSYPILNDAIS